jgi:hypothetical protein
LPDALTDARKNTMFVLSSDDALDVRIPQTAG